MTKKNRPFSRDNFTCEILQTSNFAGSRLKRVINVKKEILMNMCSNLIIMSMQCKLINVHVILSRSAKEFNAKNRTATAWGLLTMVI